MLLMPALLVGKSRMMQAGLLRTGWRLRRAVPWSATVHDYFTWWNCDGTFDRIHHGLYADCRDKAERGADPTAGIIDSLEREKRRKSGAPASIRTRSMPAS
jgi:hypothetical protein